LFNLGMGEITVILMLALIFIGPKKLPELASGLGKLIREIRKTTADVKNEIQLDDSIRKPLEELREAVTLHPAELKRRDRLRQDLLDLQRRAQEVSAAMPESPEGDKTGTVAETNDTAPSNQTTIDANPAGASDATAVAAPHSVDHAAAAVTPPPVPVVPTIPGAAPMGTVAREPSSPVAAAAGAHAPPAPPLAAVLLAKGSGPVTTPERRPFGGAGGSDFLRSLRAVPDARKPAPPTPVVSAADRSNTTQTLTEADLAAVTVGPPPPPPPRSSTGQHQTIRPPAQPSPPRLPGATPRKNPNQ
jgi:sec-independent protein translocase protein TatB